MGTFVTTVKFTDQGMKDMKSTCKRAEKFKATAEPLGIQVKEIFWTLGPVDGVLIFDAPDEETATTAMLHLASFGNVHTQTSRAYRADEMEGIVGKL